MTSEFDLYQAITYLTNAMGLGLGITAFGFLPPYLIAKAVTYPEKKDLNFKSQRTQDIITKKALESVAKDYCDRKVTLIDPDYYSLMEESLKFRDKRTLRKKIKGKKVELTKAFEERGLPRVIQGKCEVVSIN